VGWRFLVSPFKHFVIATDLSPETLGVEKLAVMLAKAHQARITFLHVDDFADSFTRYYAYAEIGMAASAARAKEEEVGRLKQKSLEKRALELCGQIYPGQSTKILSGEPVAQILDFVQGTASSQPCDLLILAKKKRNLLEEFILGSTATHVLDGAKVPIMVVPAMDLGNVSFFESVLLATGLSPASEKVAHQTAEFLSCLQPKNVTLLHVLESRAEYFPLPMVDGVAGIPAHDFHLLYDLVDANAQKDLAAQARSVFTVRDIPCLPQIAYGQTTEQLLLESKKHDLVVVGTTAEKPLSYTLLGSTARTLLGKCSKPILVFPK
jgi:nucleotide-binding universal stress UspA family protein